MQRECRAFVVVELVERIQQQGTELTLRDGIVQRERRDTKTRQLTIATWVSLGVTAAAGAGTVVAGVLALRADGDVDDELTRFPADPDAVDRAAERRDSLSLTTDIMVGGTAAFAVTTLGLGIATIMRKRKAKPSALGLGQSARDQSGRHVS